MGQVTVEVRDSVAVFTIDNPEVANALDTQMGEQFLQLCDEVDADRSIGAAILRGAGTTFCSGADTREWKGDLLSDEWTRSAEAIYGSFLRFGRLKVPTVVAVRGTAFGGGLNLALSGDLRIVADNARLIGGFLRLGIHPGGGFFALVNRAAGREATAAMGLFGEQVSGTRAVELGLAWESVPDDAVKSRAMELARRAARDPDLSRRTAVNLRRTVGPPAIPWEAALEADRGVQLWSMQRRRDAEG